MATVVVGLSGCTAPPETPSVLLITIDTLRADHLSCYGHGRQTTPVIDRLASAGARFDACYTTVPITLPSHCSIMTGLYPIGHGVRDNARYQHLDETNRTLAEILRDAGYETAAVVSAFPLDQRFGIAQGFDFYDDAVDEAYLARAPGDRPPPDREGRVLWERQRTRFQQRAGATTDKALAWLKNRRPDRPFFLWVHYFDPHDPYDPPAPFDRAFAPRADGVLAARSAAYDGEIRYTDEQLGRLLGGLAAEGELDRCLLVLTADHGEGLGQHQVNDRPDLYHGSTLFTEGLRVPLVVRWPGHVPAGAVVPQHVSNLDVLPTVLELLGMDLPGGGPPGLGLHGNGLHGRSLAPILALAGGGTVAALPSPDLFFETLLPQIRSGLPPLAAVQDDRWKFITRGGEDDALYDLRDDPGETDNLVAATDHAATVQWGRRSLQEWKERCAAGEDLDNQLPLDEASLEKLRALGYVSDDDSYAGVPR